MEAWEAKQVLNDIMRFCKIQAKILKPHTTGKNLMKQDRADLKDGIEILVEKLVKVYMEFVCDRESRW